MEIIRLHYQRGGFDFLKKHSLARNLSSSVSTWEGWDEVSDCPAHSSLCSWCMSQEAQRSTAAASSFFFLRGGSLTLSSVSSEARKALRGRQLWMKRQQACLPRDCSWEYVTRRTCMYNSNNRKLVTCIIRVLHYRRPIIWKHNYVEDGEPYIVTRTTASLLYINITISRTYHDTVKCIMRQSRPAAIFVHQLDAGQWTQNLCRPLDHLFAFCDPVNLAFHLHFGTMRFWLPCRQTDKITAKTSAWVMILLIFTMYLYYIH